MPAQSLHRQPESSVMIFPMLNGFFFPIPGGPAAILSPALPEPALEPGGDEPPPTLNGAS